MIREYYLAFLSPIISFIILGLITTYFLKKIKSIRILPKDYLILINLEKKIKKLFSSARSHFEELEGIFLSIILKILQRIKTESLKIQIWAEKHLTSLKERQK